VSADNFLGIYKANGRRFIGRDCWSECERDNCRSCYNRVVFIAKSPSEAVGLAEKACNEDNYEYGYRFLNLA